MVLHQNWAIKQKQWSMVCTDFWVSFEVPRKLGGIPKFLLGLHLGGSDWFNTKTNNQTEPVGFLINRSDPTDGEDLNRTEQNQMVRFGSVG